MKVVAFNGSPRVNGNTSEALKMVLAELEQEGIATELVQLGGKKVFGVPGAQRAAERLGDGFARVVRQAEQDLQKRQMFCECELVSLGEIDHVARDGDCFTLGDIRRKTRMGMGTCQGTFCSYRTLGALSKYPRFAGNHREYLTEFLQKRWKGIRPVLWGQQLREAQLAIGIYCSLFGMERMK